MSEELLSLITLAQAGDEGAFADLTVQYKPLLESSVKSYSKRYSGELYSEEDFFQEASLAFYSAVCSYKESNGVTFGLYAKICIRNRLISLLRSSAKKERKNRKEDQGYTEPSMRLLEKEDFERLRSEACGALSELEKQVFEMYIQKKSYVEIAEKLGRSVKTVDNALFRIKTKLKKLR